jgi:hypothetical protein
MLKVPKSKQVLQLTFEEGRSAAEDVIDGTNGIDEVI